MVYKRLLTYIKSYWPAFVIAAIGNVIYSSVDSYSIYLFKPLLDKGFIAKDVAFLKTLPLIILGIFILRGLGSFSSGYCMGWMGRHVVLRFRKDIFSRFLAFPAKFFDQNTSGQMLAKLTYNVEQVTQATGNTFTTLVRESCFVIGLLIVMFITSWKFTLVLLAVVPLFVVIVQYVSKRFRKLSTRIQNAMGDVTHIAEETIVGYRDVRLFAAQKHQRNRFFKVADYNFLQEMKIILTDTISTPIIQLIGAFVLAFLVYIAFRHGKPIISAGSFVTLFSSMLAILKPIKNLSKVNASIQRGLAGAQSVFELLDEDIEKDNASKVLDNVKGDIKFDNVDFAYKKNELVLRKISFNIKPGETVAFVGRSGGGKSTLVSLLARFYTPKAGKILLDGEDIKKLSLAFIRSKIAVVSQHVTLFDDTVFNNIAFGCNEGAAEADVMAAAKAAHAWEFIKNLPQGMNTKVGENGLNLSGGQRQRIAIARAFLKNAPILILDEATSALDNKSERVIQKAIEELKKNRTTMIIAHRLSTIENADKIIVMQEGCVIEQGSHAKLLEKGGVYAALYDSAVF